MIRAESPEEKQLLDDLKKAGSMIGLRDQDAHVFIQMGILVTIRGVDVQYTGVKMSAGTGKTYGKNLFRRGTEIVPGAGRLFKLFQYAGNFHRSFSCAWQTEPDRLNFI